MLKRDISTSNILIVAVSSMIGSGWLFGPFISAQMAGANALISWIIAAIFIFIIALPLCEIATLLPLSGGLSTYPTLTYGKEVGLLFAWTSWLSYVVATPIETQAVLQYASYFFPVLIDTHSATFHLSGWGYCAALGILTLLTFINTLGVKLLAECSRYAGILKFLIPCIAIISLFYVSGFPHLSGKLAIHLHEKKDWEDIFTALSTGGVIFAFMGFQNSLMLAGEVKNPGRILSIATLSAIGIGFIFYFFLQLSFLNAVPAQYLLHGWSQLSFPDAQSPLVGLTILLGLGTIALFILIDSSLSPLGTALLLATASSRILYSMALNQHLPPFLLKLNKHKIPYNTLLVNFAVGMFLFLPFPGWEKMAAFLSSAGLLGYSIGPLCLMAMRKLQPHHHRPFKIPCASLICYLAFYIGNLMFHWCGFEIIWKLCIALLIGLIIHMTYKKEWHIIKKPAVQWFFSYVGSLFIISYLGPFGGIQVLQFPYDLILLFPVSCLIFYFSQKCLCSDEAFQEHLKQIKEKI